MVTRVHIALRVTNSNALLLYLQQSNYIAVYYIYELIIFSMPLAS